MKNLNVIIGGGAVGLAIAEKLSKTQPCLLIERNSSFGMETSSRNSEVIHSGIYYPTESLKAKLCVRGNQLLYPYLEKNSIKHKRCGKYIIARSYDELLEAKDLLQLAEANGVTGMKEIDRDTMGKLVPNIHCVGGLFSSATGVFDSHKYMASLELNAIENGCDFAYNHQVINISKNEESYEIRVLDTDGNESKISAKRVINSAGLGSDKVAELVGIDIDKYKYRLKFCRGHYYRLAKREGNKFKNLIYPLPASKNGLLGIHVIIGLDTSIRLGPDIEYLPENKQIYDIPLSTQKEFFESISTYFNEVNMKDLSPDTSGIRPRLESAKNGFADFIINEESDKGYKNFYNLIGIESPGLTSSLAIAEYIENLINSNTA